MSHYPSDNVRGTAQFGAEEEEDLVKAVYTCGECGSFNDISKQDQVRCRECGVRIFYKMRAKNKPMEYEAR